MDNMWHKKDLDDIPVELKSLILEESIGTRPFSYKEIEWILETFNRIQIFYFKNDEFLPASQMCCYKSHKNNKELWELDNIKVFTAPHRFGIESASQKLYTHDIFIDQLTDRFDSGIIRNVNIEVKDIMLSTYYLREADIIIPDLITLYNILKRRFNAIIPDNPIKSSKLARKYTQYYLDNLMGYFHDKLAPLLLSYIEECGYTFFGLEDLWDKADKFTKIVELTEETENKYYKDIENILKEFYEAMSYQLINNSSLYFV